MPTKDADVTQISPIFWLSTAIGALRKNIVLTRLVRRDMDTIVANEGKTITIPKRGSVSVRTKAAGLPITSDSPTSTGVDVTLDTRKYVSWAIEDGASAKAVKDGVDYVTDAMIGLAESVDADVAAQYTNFTTEVGTAGTDIDQDTILEARLSLNTLLCPQTDRFLVVSAKDEISILREPQFVSSDKRGQAGIDALTEAQLGRIYGFDVYMSQSIVSTSAPTTYHGWAACPHAVALASRALPLPEAGSGAIGMIMPDPVSGLVFRYVQAYSATDQAMIRTIDCLYGLATVDVRMAVEVLS